MTTEDINSPKMQALLKKIRALKAKADDASTTEAESMAFAAKVAELLAMYSLEEAQLEIGNGEESTPISHEEYVANWNASPARRVLAIAVCRLYNVSPLIRTGKGQAWTLVGRKHNVIMVKEMVAYLIKTTVRLSNAWGKSNPLGDVIDFRRGCFKRLSERLYELYQETAKSTAPVYTNNNPGNLPALYLTESKLLTAYIASKWRTKPLRAARIRQGASAMAGREAGDGISLNRQVGGASSRFMIGNGK
jgi:hypothetical protein